MAEKYDIIIVGGGLVGASLAVALANTDLSIAIVEAQPERQIDINNVDTRSIVLSYATEKIFKTLKVWNKLLTYLTPIKMIHISDKGHFGVTRLRAADHGVDAMGYSISAPVLAKVLYEYIDQADNITWIRPATVTTLTEKSISVNNQEINAKLIIAADGGHSKICELLGISSETTDYNQSAVVANITCQQDHQCTAYERFTQEGPMALLPIRGQRMTLVWTTTHDKAKKLASLDEAEFLIQLQHTFGYRAGKFIAANKRSCYPLNLTVSEEQVKKGILILGNAAHALHPVSAQGFNLGLRDVAQLAEELLSVEKSQVGDPKLLAKYLAARKDDQEATIRYTDDLVRIFSTDAFPITPVRGWMLSKLNNMPLVKNMIARRAMGFRGKASKLLRGIELS